MPDFLPMVGPWLPHMPPFPAGKDLLRRCQEELPRAGAGLRTLDSVAFVIDNLYELEMLHDCNLNVPFRLPRCGVGCRESLLSRHRYPLLCEKSGDELSSPRLVTASRYHPANSTIECVL